MGAYLLNKIVIIGQVGVTHGIRGWVKIHSYTESPTQCLQYRPWLIKLQEKWEPINIIDHKIVSKGLLILFEDCSTPEEAQRFTKTYIGIPRNQLPPLPANSYYWTDLENLKVINQNNIELGYVDYLFTAGASDILVVQGEHQQHLIPYKAGEFILNVDLEKKQIHVNWDPL